VTGLLVEPRSPAALADALAMLITDPHMRRRLADAGFERTTRGFSLAAGADALARRFAATLQTA
jgi:type III pantothenate kinase